MNLSVAFILSAIIEVLSWMPGFASTNQLPGLSFHDPPFTLDGTLVFLYSNNGTSTSNAHIYAYDIREKSVTMVASCPGGYFDAAKNGEIFCVRYGIVNGFGFFITNAFIYSQRLKETAILTFETSPTRVTFAATRVVFHFSRRILDYNIRTKQLTLRTNGPPENTGDGGSAHELQDDFHPFGFKSREGRWVFFEGSDDPLQGTRLVSSPLNHFDTRLAAPAGRNVRVLKRFSKPINGSLHLEQLSPCREYALVRQATPVGDHQENFYSVIDLASGRTFLLMDDRVCSIPGASVSHVYWVGPPALSL